MNIAKEQIIKSIFYPRISSADKDDKDLLIPVEGNVHIGVRLYMININAPNIIYFHANAEIAKEYDGHSELYNHFGINLIVCGYRGYGLSNGNPSKEYLHADSLKIFDYISNYLSENKYNGLKIIMGRSLGSAAAFHVIDNKSNHIDGCIIESGFATETPLLGLMGIDPKQIDYKLEDGFENLKKIKNYTKPLLVIHSDLDEIIPFSQADMMMIECPSKSKEIFKVEGAGHNDIIAIAREHYFSNIRDFIEKI
tara:strand:- start:2104 stop:2862 length:759 start_codon:yes stop_codon:yes gene_type:complete